MNEFSYYSSRSCYNKTLPGLMHSFYFRWSWNTTFALFMHMDCKELSSTICFCWLNIKSYLCCKISYLNGQFYYGPICCQFSSWNTMFLAFHILSWLNGQLYYEQSMWDRWTYKKFWLHFILPPCAYYYNLMDKINSYPCGPLAPAHFNE